VDDGLDDEVEQGLKLSNVTCKCDSQGYQIQDSFDNGEK
jgi:hypothetical protein